MSNFNFFSNAFAKVIGAKKIDLSSNICVKDSSDITITGNQFNQSVTYVFDGFTYSCDDDISHSTIATNFKPSMANNKTDRALLNIDYIERFIFECNRQSIIPTIRCYAFFSHISSIRTRNDTNEYNQLVLAEKDLFDKMLDLNFRIKLIVCLDIPIILVKWYDNINETIGRITDLTDRVDDICNKKNIEIVIDDMNCLDGQFILHDCLHIHALDSDPINKYSITKYETNKSVIQNSIKIFDDRYKYLSHANSIVKKFIRSSSVSSLIKLLVDSRLEQINKKYGDEIYGEDKTI